MIEPLDAEDLLRRLGLAIKRINVLESQRYLLKDALKGLADRVDEVEPHIKNAPLLDDSIHGDKYKGPGWWRRKRRRRNIRLKAGKAMVKQ